MRTQRGARAVISMALICVAGSAAAADQPAKDAHAGRLTSAGTGTATTGSGDPAAMQMHRAMMDGMEEMRSIRTTGDADQDFATMMEHHHAQAVKLTQVYLKGGRDPKLRSWAQKSLDSQQKELSELRALNVAGGSSRQADAKQQ